MARRAEGLITARPNGLREGEAALGKAAASGRVGGAVGLAVAGLAALHAKPAWEVAGRGRAVAGGRAVGVCGRAKPVVALTPACAASAVGASAKAAAIPRAAPACAAVA